MTSRGINNTLSTRELSQVARVVVVSREVIFGTASKKRPKVDHSAYNELNDNNMEIY